MVRAFLIVFVTVTGSPISGEPLGQLPLSNSSDPLSARELDEIDMILKRVDEGNAEHRPGYFDVVLGATLLGGLLYYFLLRGRSSSVQDGSAYEGVGAAPSETDVINDTVTASNWTDSFWLTYWYFRNGAYGLWSGIALDGLFTIAVVLAGFYFGGPVLGLISLGLPIYSVVAFTREYQRRKHNAPHKGRVVMKSRYARVVADRLRNRIDANDPGIMWGNIRIPSQDAVKGFAIVGDIGSGKTLTFRIMMRDVLRRLKKGIDARAVVYDPKGDYLGHLMRMGLQVPVVILNPFDRRHIAWNCAGDIDNPIIAKDFSEQLFPSNPRATHKFFEDAPQALGSSVLRVFIKKRPGRWTFRQFLLVMRDDQLIRKIAGADEAADATVKRFLSMSGEGRGNVMATVTSKLAPYEEIAACWEHAAHKFSLRDWLSPQSSSVLVLGNYEIARKSIDLVNKLYVNMLAKFALNLPDDEHRRNWFFFDELTEGTGGDFNGLLSLILRGRSKGCCTACGFQDIDAVYETFGEHRGRSLVGQCGNKALLRMSSEPTAKWASGLINEYVQDWGDVLGKDGDKARSAFPPEYFMNLPAAGRIHGLHGVYLSPSVGCYSARYTPAELNRLLDENKPKQAFSALELVPDDWLDLAPWNAEDSRQFGIEHGQNGRTDRNDDENGLDDIDRFEL